MTRTIVTPVACRGRAVELAADAKGRRRWRKQILPLGELELDGNKLRFDKPYLTRLAKAWEDRAVDHVPLQLATGRNEHNNDPELTRGLIDDVGMHRPGEAPGLYASVTTGKRGSDLLDEFPEIGVSVRLIEDLENASQGRVYPWALQHVLATWDPRISGMTGWTEAPDADGATDLSRTGGRVVDLSRSTYAQLGRKGAQMATKDEIKTKLTELLKEAAGELAAEGDEELTDDELTELALGFFGDLEADDDQTGKDGQEGKPAPEEGKDDEGKVDDPDDVDQRQLVDAAARHTRDLELAHQRTDDALTQLHDLTAERDASNWEAERQRYIDKGISPHVIDLARPALEGKGKTIELSNGDRTDAGTMVREILDGFAKVGLVDLSRSVGTAHDGSDQSAEQSNVDRLAKDLLSGI